MGIPVNKNLVWVGILTFAVFLAGLFSPEWHEQFYGQWVFPSVRLSMNALSFAFPFPLFWFFIPAFTFWVLWRLLSIFRNSSLKLWNRGWQSLLFLAKVILIAICFFYWVWGFNYLRPSSVERLNLNTTAVEKERVFELLEDWTGLIGLQRQRLSESGMRTEEDLFAHRVDYGILVDGLNDFLGIHNYPSFQHMPLRHWIPHGILLRNGTAGMYFPFTGESTIDPGLHPLQIPFTSAHEMGHGAGFTDEGFCNLLALLICIRAEDPFINYSGGLTFWRHIARAARSLDGDRYREFIEESLPEEIREDLQSIYRHRDRYPDWFSGLQRMMYHTYLRAHGVSEGVASYSQMLMLAESYFELYGESEQHFN